MDPKMTTLVGAGLIVLALLLLIFSDTVQAATGIVLIGLLTLFAILLAVLFLIMGLVQLREERAASAKDAEDARRREAMTAQV